MRFKQICSSDYKSHCSGLQMTCQNITGNNFPDLSPKDTGFNNREYILTFLTSPWHNQIKFIRDQLEGPRQRSSVIMPGAKGSPFDSKQRHKRIQLTVSKNSSPTILIIGANKEYQHTPRMTDKKARKTGFLLNLSQQYLPQLHSLNWSLVLTMNLMTGNQADVYHENYNGFIISFYIHGLLWNELFEVNVSRGGHRYGHSILYRLVLAAGTAL